MSGIRQRSLDGTVIGVERDPIGPGLAKASGILEVARFARGRISTFGDLSAGFQIAMAGFPTFAAIRRTRSDVSARRPTGDRNTRTEGG